MSYGYISPLNTRLTREELIERYNELIDYIEEMEISQQIYIEELNSKVALLEDLLDRD